MSGSEKEAAPNQTRIDTFRSLPPDTARISRLCQICSGALSRDINAWRDRPLDLSGPVQTIAVSPGDILARSSWCELCAIVADRVREVRLHEGPHKPIYELTNRELFTRRPVGAKSESSVFEGLRTIALAFCYTSFTNYRHSDPLRQLKPILVGFQPCSLPFQKVSDLFNDNPVPLEAKGRILDPVRADLRLPKYWLNRCITCHHSCCSSPTWAQHLDQAKDLLLIDVKLECVVNVERTQNVPYAALSYHWGNTDIHKLTKAKVDKARQPDWLKTVDLPVTIADAVIVTRALGLNYLWVDALCIVQDDQAHVHHQISQMAKIYSRAEITIIAATKDASAGLPGVRPGTRTIDQRVIYLENMALVTMLKYQPRYFDQSTKSQFKAHSKWSTRAWTLQEQFFSRRKLIFADDQIYWHCESAKWLEEIGLESTAMWLFNGYEMGENRDGALEVVSGPEIPYDIDGQKEYISLVEGYMRRDLTYESDRLNGFLGISDSFSVTYNSRHFWGLPGKRFVHFLLWDMEGGTRTRISHFRASDSGSIHAVSVPSWSWFAWKPKDKSMSNIYILSFTDIRSDVIFHRCDSNGKLEKIENTEEWSSEQAIERKLWNSGSGWNISDIGDDTGQFCNSLDTGLLKFKAETATLCIGRNTHRGRGILGKPAKPYYVLDSPRYSKGLEWEWIRYGSKMEIYLGSTAHLPTLDSIEGPLLELDFIAIGHRGATTSLRDSNPSRIWVFLLVVEWENNVAYRIGIAATTKRNWLNLTNRKMKAVTLG